MLIMITKEEMKKIANKLSGRKCDEQIDVPIIMVTDMPVIPDKNLESSYRRPEEFIDVEPVDVNNDEPECASAPGLKARIADYLARKKSEREYIAKYESNVESGWKVAARVMKKIITGDIYEKYDPEAEKVPYDPVRDVLCVNKNYMEDIDYADC